MMDSDAIVIGSGAGGLTAALALARAGKSVTVFERHYLPGGYSQSFTTSGFRFSPGVHYIGQLGPGGALRHIYEGLGVADDLVFLELDRDGYDRAFIGSEHFDIPAGIGPLGERLKSRFPSEAHGIDGYLQAVSRMSEELQWATLPASIPEALSLPKRVPTLLRHGMRSLSSFLDDFTSDPLLRAILSIQSGDHGMAPSRAPAALHAGLQGYYMDGGCYPRGGAHVIPEAFIRQIEKHGGRVVLRANVERVLTECGRAIGVRLADGTEVRASMVIADVDPGSLWQDLVDRADTTPRLRRRVRNLRYSVSTLSLFMAVDMDLRAAGLDSGNVWYSRTTDIEEVYSFGQRPVLTGSEEIPGLFFNVTTLKDPSMRSDGLHTVEAIALASPDAFSAWKDTQPGSRPAEYRALKQQFTQRILEAVENFVPGIAAKVVFSTLGTPLTNTHFLAVHRGGIYGSEKSLRNLGPFSFPIQTPIDGLFHCGASTIAPGIHGVTRSGLAAAAAALDCSEAELLTARSGPLRVFPCEDVSAWPPELRPQRSAPALPADRRTAAAGLALAS